MSAADDRQPRELETRANEARAAIWKPPSALPDPHPRPGLVHRWVRVSCLGTPDPGNVSASVQEGWEPVRAADYPELEFRPDRNSRYPENVEIGGLLLCAAPANLMKQRTDHYAAVTKRQMEAVNDQLDREGPQSPRQGRITRSFDTKIGFGPDARRNA